VKSIKDEVKRRTTGLRIWPIGGMVRGAKPPMPGSRGEEPLGETKNLETQAS